MSNMVQQLTHKKRLMKNIGFNFILTGITMVIGVLTVPHIIQGLGVERFGILTIMWSVIGYSSLFDFGLGSAMTQVIARKLGSNDIDEIPEIVWTGLIIIFALGLAAGTGLYFASPILVKLLRVAPDIYGESVASFHWLALSLPFLISMFGLKSVLESYQKFLFTGSLRLLILFFNYVVPLIVLVYSHSLTTVVFWLVMGRVISFITHFIVVMWTVDDLLLKVQVRKAHFKELISFGSWVTVSNVIIPFMTYLDRFLISMMLTANIIAYYATPYDVITKMSSVSASIMLVMYPAMTTQMVTDMKRTKAMYHKSLISIFGILILPVIVLIFFAKPLITVWINADFAAHSYQIAQLLALGMFVNCLNSAPFSVIQAAGRSDVNAKIHMIEFPVYLPLLYFLVQHYGILGAPMAYVIRVAIDTVILHIIALKYLNAPATPKPQTA